MRHFGCAYDFVQWWLKHYPRVASPGPTSLARVEQVSPHMLLPGQEEWMLLPHHAKTEYEITDRDLDAIEANRIMANLSPKEQCCIVEYVGHKKRVNDAWNATLANYRMSKSTFIATKNRARARIHRLIKQHGMLTWS